MLYFTRSRRVCPDKSTYVHASEVLLSPILVRPVREQLEHDRVIRLLQAKYKRKFDVAINPGNEQTLPVTIGTSPWFPDLVLQSNERSKKLMGTVEVETAESVNHLEAMSQWKNFSGLRAPFHLYVPASSIDTARRLCADLGVTAAEIWAYNALGDQMRFTLVQRSDGGRGKSASAGASAPRKPRPAAAAPRRPAAPARTAPARTAPARTAPARAAAAPARPARRAAPAAPARAKKTVAKKRAPARAAAPRGKKTAGSTRAQKRK
jgi:hypothetical protein